MENVILYFEKSTFGVTMSWSGRVGLLFCACRVLVRVGSGRKFGGTGRLGSVDRWTSLVRNDQVLKQ